MQAVSTNAYAKINLTLDITGRRGDGYHTLESVMHTISLCDRVLVRLREGEGITLGCNLPYLPRDGKNLAVRAAALFWQKSGLTPQATEIHIKKAIPVGAGMAGGSTDAAAVLRLLNRMTGFPFSRVALAELALELGADVPFCLRIGAALASGIGEKLKTVPALPPCHIVVCKPLVSVSTKRAYELVDACDGLTHPPAGVMLDALARRDFDAVCAALGNSMAEPIEREKPQIADIRRQLLQLGAQGAVMTGSGSAVFALFRKKAAAEAAARIMGESWREVFLCKPVCSV